MVRLPSTIALICVLSGCLSKDDDRNTPFILPTGPLEEVFYGYCGRDVIRDPVELRKFEALLARMSENIIAYERPKESGEFKFRFAGGAKLSFWVEVSPYWSWVEFATGDERCFFAPVEPSPPTAIMDMGVRVARQVRESPGSFVIGDTSWPAEVPPRIDWAK